MAITRKALLERAPHLQYAYDVIDRKIQANKLVKEQCRRVLAEHRRGYVDIDVSKGEETQTERYRYRQEGADAILDFLKEVPHVEGEFAIEGKTLVLEPWQVFFVSEVYGWRSVENPRKRRYLTAILEVAKKKWKDDIMCWDWVVRNAFRGCRIESLFGCDQTGSGKNRLGYCGEHAAENSGVDS